MVLIVSGRGKDSLERGSHNMSGLGYPQNMVIGLFLFFITWTIVSVWESCGLAVGLDRRKIVLLVMEHHTRATDGS